MRFRVFTFVVAVIVGVGALHAQDRVREQKLQQAIDLLETKGDVAGATPLLEDVAKSADRALAARGLLYLGQAQERQGKDRARQTYGRVVREFNTQTEAVAQARERLALLGDGASASGSVSHRLLSTFEANSEIGSVSRDGRFVGYTTPDSLTIKDIRNGTSRVIKAGKDQWFGDAVLSRNGARVAVPIWNDAENRDELHVADASTNYSLRQVWVGENQSRVSDRALAANPLDWTPDGTRVLVALHLPRWTQSAVQGALLGVDDGRLETIQLKGESLDTAVISPSGKHVAYEIGGRSGATDISVVAIDGGTEQPVVVHGAHDRLVGWIPDETGIVFSSRRIGGEGLWLARMASGKPVGDAEFLVSHGGALQYFGVTSTGTVHYGPQAGMGGRYVRVGAFDFRAGQWRTPPSDTLNEVAVGPTEHPDWSPDGKEVAYIALNAPGERPRPHVVFRLADSDLSTRSVALPLIGIRWLRWTKDGSAVLVYGYDPAWSLSLLRIDRASSEVVTVAVRTDGAPDAFGGWSNDGKRVYLQRQLPDGGIVLIEREWAGGEERELFRAPDRAGYPVLSPDGTKLYYSRSTSTEHERRRISVAIERDMASGRERELSDHRNLGGMNLSPDGRYIATGSNDPTAKTRSFILIRTDGGGTKTLMTIPITEASLAGGANPLGLYAWAPDSSAMILRNDLTGELWWVPIDERAPRAVATAGMGRVVSAGNPAIHPDGSRIVFHSRTTTAPKAPELWVIDNLLRKGK